MLAAIYVRISDNYDDRSASLDTQEASCRAAAQAAGDQVAEVFVERHTSRQFWDRPELVKLRDAIRARRFGKVYVHALDRIARDVTYQTILFEEFERSRCKLVSATEDLDNSPEGELIRTIRGYVAQVERAKIEERTRRGTRRIKEQG